MTKTRYIQIEFYEKHIYGLPSLFIKDQQIAKQISSITGRKTIVQNDMNVLRRLFGADFIQVIN